MPVAQGPEKPRLGTIEMHVGPKRRVELTARVELGVGALTEELVGEHDLIEHAIVHRVDHAVVRAPEPGIEVGETGIVPPDHGFVRGHLLQVPVQPQVLAEPFVDARDVRVAVGPTLAGDDEATVDLREERPIRIGIVEHVGTADTALRCYRRVRATHCREAQEGGGNAECLDRAIHGSVPPKTGCRARC